MVSCPEVTVVSVDDVDKDMMAEERKIQMQKEDIMKKPENIRQLTPPSTPFFWNNVPEYSSAMPCFCFNPALLLNSKDASKTTQRQKTSLGSCLSQQAQYFLTH